MQLTGLAVPDCPNAAVLDQRLADALGGRTDVSVGHQVVADENEAARWGMRGSPTLLIDGSDPFAGPGDAPGMSCRLYRDEEGRLSGAPSSGQLRQAIGQALAVAAGTPAPPATMPIGLGLCWECALRARPGPREGLSPPRLAVPVA